MQTHHHLSNSPHFPDSVKRNTFALCQYHFYTFRSPYSVPLIFHDQHLIPLLSHALLSYPPGPPATFSTLSRSPADVLACWLIFYAGHPT